MPKIIRVSRTGGFFVVVVVGGGGCLIFISWEEIKNVYWDLSLFLEREKDK